MPRSATPPSLLAVFIPATLSLTVFLGCSSDSPQGAGAPFTGPDLIQEWGNFTADGLSPGLMEVIGDVLVVVGSHEIKRFNLDGTRLPSWEETVIAPRGVALGGDGNLYFATNHRRVEVFTPDGLPVRQWQVGDPPDGLNAAHLGGIDLDSAGNIYVVDRDLERIHKYTSRGEHVLSWGQASGAFTGLVRPHLLAVLTDGTVLVGDGDGFEEFSESGAHLGPWPGSVTAAIDLVELSDGTLVISSFQGFIHHVARDGTLLNRWGRDPEGYRYTYLPRAIAADTSGNVYVGDFVYQAIFRFDLAGDLLDEWRPDWEDGLFRWPRAVVATEEDVIVLDMSSRIQRFRRSGEFLAIFGKIGERPGHLWSPLDLAVDPAGNVYVADWANQRIAKFDRDGSPLGTWPSSPRHLAISPRNTLYVATGDGIKEYALDGELLVSRLGYPDEAVSFQAIDVGPAGNIFALEEQTRTVRVIDEDGHELASWPLHDAGGDPQIHDLVVGSDYRVMIAFAERVDVFTDRGRFIGSWDGARGEPAAGRGFYWPRGLDVDPHGDLWLVDGLKHNVQHYEPVWAPGVR